MQCNLTIDSQPVTYDVEGDFFWGEDEVLYEKDSDTLSDASWEADGFSIIHLFSSDEHAAIKDSLTRKLQEIIFEVTGREISNLQISQYHKYVSSEEHREIIFKTRNLDFSSFVIDKDALCEKVAHYLGKRVVTKNLELEHDIVILRISRPNTLDINPPHRDGYLKIWQRTINLWIPIVGCEQKSSLPLIPGSHHWNEKKILRTQAKGAKIEGNPYHVPAILDTTDGLLNFVRPNPKEGDALIFTPYLVHGSAINQLEDTTRMSLEIRLPIV